MCPSGDAREVSSPAKADLVVRWVSAPSAADCIVRIVSSPPGPGEIRFVDGISDLAIYFTDGIADLTLHAL